MLGNKKKTFWDVFTGATLIPIEDWYADATAYMNEPSFGVFKKRGADDITNLVLTFIPGLKIIGYASMGLNAIADVAELSLPALEWYQKLDLANVAREKYFDIIGNIRNALDAHGVPSNLIQPIITATDLGMRIVGGGLMVVELAVNSLINVFSAIGKARERWSNPHLRAQPPGLVHPITNFIMFPTPIFV
jgi:hypothetical protein